MTSTAAASILVYSRGGGNVTPYPIKEVITKCPFTKHRHINLRFKA